MREIINDFFNKENRIHNVTIEELLQEYELNTKDFWKYAYEYNVSLAQKIKEESKRRSSNKKSLEIYFLLKEKGCTFGELARELQCSVDDICERLKNEYLAKRICNYSYDKMFSKNAELLKQKKTFQMYFYFLENNVNFEELAEIFEMDVATVVYYFDSVITEELSSKQVQDVFRINKSRERYTQQRQRLSQLFTLTPEESQNIHIIIDAFNKKLFSGEDDSIFQQYRTEWLLHRNPKEITKKVEALHALQKYLSTGEFSMIECCKDFCLKKSIMYDRLKQDWVAVMLKPQILAKLSIRMLIENTKIYKCKQENFELVEYYMTTFAEYLNATTKSQKNANKDNLILAGTIDEELNTNIFRKIVEVIKDMESKEKISNNGDTLSNYYKEHFILLQDLATYHGMSVEEIKKYYKYNESQKEVWADICEIEESRQQTIHQNASILFEYADLLKRWIIFRDTGSFETEKIREQLEQIIQNKFHMVKLEREDTYLNALVRAANFTAMYLMQDDCQVDDLKEQFGIKGKVDRYLYHELVKIMLDPEIVQYIHLKRSVSQQLGREKGCQKFLENQTYLNRDRNASGQFTKQTKE